MEIFLSILISLIVIFLLLILADFLYFKSIFSRDKNSEITEKNFYKNLKNHKCNSIEEKIKNNKNIFEDAEHKSVSVLSIDDYHLFGKLYLSDDVESKKSVILCHGFKSTGELDFCIAFKKYKEENYNILIIDQRAHSKSSGKYSSMGIMESYDIVAWCKWLEMCFGTESDIVIHGVDMGAFAAIAAGANSEMPKNIKCIIADSFYPLIYKVIFDKAEKNLSFLSKPAVAFMNAFFRNHVGFDMRDFSLYTIAKDVKIPVLFVHSENDATTPLAIAENIMNRIPAKTDILKIKKALHGTCFIKEENECMDSINKFIGEL